MIFFYCSDLMFGAKLMHISQILEAPSIAPSRSIPQAPQFQEFHLKTTERANQHAESIDSSCQVNYFLPILNLYQFIRWSICNFVYTRIIAKPRNLRKWNHLFCSHHYGQDLQELSHHGKWNWKNLQRFQNLKPSHLIKRYVIWLSKFERYFQLK